MGQPGAPIRDQTILLRLSGLLNGGLDAATDAPATIVERRYGRPLLAGFHGAWSVAGLLAAGLGSALTGRGVPVVPHVLAVALVLHYYSSRLERVFVPGVPESRLSMGLLLTDVANLVGLDAALPKAVAWHESSWRMVEGPSGEIGVMQVMPSMAQWVQRTLISYPLDPHERANNILEGTLLCYYLDRTGVNTHKTLALYHSGNIRADGRNGRYLRAATRSLHSSHVLASSIWHDDEWPLYQAVGAHIIDPHIGRPREGALSSTVMGPELATADAYATAAYAMGLDGPTWTAGLVARSYEALDYPRRRDSPPDALLSAGTVRSASTGCSKSMPLRV